MPSKQVPDIIHNGGLSGTEEFHLVAGVVRDGGGNVTNHGNSRRGTVAELLAFVQTGSSYATRAAMAARTSPAPGDGVSLLEAGREGNFVVDLAANWTAEIAADTAQGIFVASTADATKVYRRLFGGDVSVKWFGAIGDGVTNDTPALQNAIDSLGAAGGRVTIANGLRCLIDANLTVKPNVSLIGPHQFVGSPQDNTSAPYGSLGGALIVNSAATITMNGGSALKGLLIYRKGMAFPAPDSSAFAGTAVTVGGDDVTVNGCMILGFAQAILSNGYQRPTFSELRLDNLSGISITACNDIPVLRHVHCWPFATIASYAITPTATKLQRSGTAILLTGVADWAKISECMAYGYFRGIDLNGVNTPTVVNCSVDGTSGADVLAGCRGFSIRGATGDAKIIGCQAASQDIGFYNDTTAGDVTTLTACVAWDGATHGFFFGAGEALVTGGGAYGVPSAITYSNAASNVTIQSFFIGAGVTQAFNLAVSSTSNNLRVGDITFTALPAGSNPFVGTLTVPSIASVSPLNIPVSADSFQITGTNGIGNIKYGWAGRRITLFFSGALTIVHGTGAVDAIHLSGAANFVTAAGSTLTLSHNGTQWYEVGRAA